ncbi:MULTISPECIES: hypothetical protein [Bradyrhizobium]|uniref:Uncharacterized protein n=1 Tax=Bradyrhizobium vignae TaxID=1549949 RepID=A0A2U3Q537_9BRAD|nr:hypothetical protein [Bradyrhizobium vignae]MBP0109844.1 hypothetical protein [Bradyrhizobium vignae]SPP96466.1 protein of unknown function [Bradyrhizobium vignae]
MQKIVVPLKTARSDREPACGAIAPIYASLIVAFATRRNWNPYDVTHTHFAIVCARRSDLIETAEFAFACAWSFTFAVKSFRI